MDLFSVIFFVLLALARLALSGRDLEHLKSWSGVLIYSGLSVFSWATIFRGDPFTREYARRMVPKEYWQSRLFLDSTKSIAMGWSTAFLGADDLFSRRSNGLQRFAHLHPGHRVHDHCYSLA
ncbi:MAG TPA: hypothetical protein VN455_01070 [Methanotrichaceae archaeon]|nr:hypothetical protein [Methanotrichaceae archaeon]